MTTRQRVMLLIDADNVSADVVEQAVHRTLATHGAVHVRRAYCNAETALKQQALFKRLSVRPMVNLSAGKNSTDIAMAVDAMDLVVAERPEWVVLVSSDSDFAPLVLRLREKGARVCGIGQRGKTGDETRAAYDEFIDLIHQGVRAPAAPAATSVAGRAAVKAESAPKAEPAEKAAPSPAPKAAAKKAVTPARKTAAAKKSPATEAPTAPRRPAARKVARKTAATAPVASEPSARPAASASAPAKAATSAPIPVADTTERILQAAPALRSGSEVALNDIAQALRAAKLLGKHASSLKLFEKLGSEFAVMQHPDRVRWLGAARA